MPKYVRRLAGSAIEPRCDLRTGRGTDWALRRGRGRRISVMLRKQLKNASESEVRIAIALTASR
jgi:hypothetical protein